MNLDSYYLRARYYDPSVGRFTQQDTWMGRSNNPITLNKYLYAYADPVNTIDPSGKSGLFSFGSAQNISAILVGAAVATYSIGQSINTWDGESALSNKQRGWANIAAGLGGASKLFDLLKTKVTEREGSSVNVYHGSLNNSSEIRISGLRFDRGSTNVSRDLAAAQDAIGPDRVAVVGPGSDPGIITSIVPTDDFVRVMLPKERKYEGFYPYRLNSTEILLDDFESIELFNRHIVR